MTVFAAASLMLTACNVMDTYQVDTMTGEDGVSVNMSKAEGVVAANGDAEYAIRFWIDNIENSWGMYLDTNSDPLAQGNVDYYNYGKNNLQVVNENGTDAKYPADGSPIYAVGYYPVTKLNESTDWATFSVLPSEDYLTRPGLVDVCVTDVERGTENDPFTSNKDNELVYRHSQVKLNFQYMRSRNLNGRIAEIWITLPQDVIANKWTLETDSRGTVTYVPTAEYQTSTLDHSLIVTSTEDWYKEEGGTIYNLYYSYFRDPSKPADYISTALTDCYVLPSDAMFGPKDIEVGGVKIMVQHITFQLDGVVISSDKNIPNTRISGKVSVPLKDSKTGSWWTEDVDAGDAFTILIIIEQNRLVLLAEKGAWEKGGYITVPLNPNQQ